ncbi:MAG: hypothetical protein HZA22_10465 [Nitrospirae bacterium]|nr:hypothetical protein [Nitrospirota bacterium]
MTGAFQLLGPRLAGARRGTDLREKGASFKTIFMAILSVLFWAGTFYLFYRALGYFRGTEAIGDMLAYRLLEMVFLTFFSVLLFSNIITALSTFYLSEEMSLILTSPIPDARIYVYKFVETAFLSSWMVITFGLPVFLAYGLTYVAGAPFYLLLLPVFAAFVLIPAPLGMAAAMVLVRVFPAKRTKDIIFFLSIILVMLLYFLIRFMQPERLVNPEEFGLVADYIASVKGPSSPLMPDYWAVQALWPVLTGKGRFEPFWPAMLVSTAAALFVICGWVFGWLYRAGYSRAQEGGRYRTYGLTPSGPVLERIAGPVDAPLKALVIKDVRTFFRDTTQWSQLFLLGALVVVYIYNFKVLPLDKFPFATFFLENFIAFLNLGLAGFVIAAVAVRFVFPAVSLERESFWILRTSPLGLKGFLWAKFWSAWLPLFILAEALVLLSNHYLRASAFMSILSAVTIFFMTFGITGLGVGLGAVYPKFRFENAAQVSAGYGGIVYMLVSMCFIGGVVALLAWPVYLFFTARYRGVPETPLELAISAACFIMVVAVNIAACIWPMRLGLRCLEDLDR